MRAKTILLLLIALLFTSGVSAQTRYPKREFRGAWIQCVNGQFQGMPAEKMQQLLINQLNSLQGAGINAIIFQVRAEADALYKSSYEPWSRFLTGVQGRVPSPYWDPMQFMIDECHKRGRGSQAGLILTVPRRKERSPCRPFILITRIPNVS